MCYKIEKKDSALTEEIDSRTTMQSFWAISDDCHGQIAQWNDSSVLTRNARLKIL